MFEFANRLLKEVRDRAARRRAIGELQRFDDALLKDLGILRDQIPDYVEGRLGQLIAEPRTQVRTEVPTPTQAQDAPAWTKIEAYVDSDRKAA
ncbi:MAG: DUF1127 domain-containing protein [Pseudomonadota bacterium]